jgi:hypothetical protein
MGGGLLHVVVPICIPINKSNDDICLPPCFTLRGAGTSGRGNGKGKETADLKFVTWGMDYPIGFSRKDCREALQRAERQRSRSRSQ